ncbi:MULTISPECIES: two-component regulator propeller domain-containing protein [unclassified Spirosoma]|uniref:type IX secretion system anionic LPS delivery protein PorZ n=1 Tax=unclassified Spirosoma TaxID=2621999 RepID=UPI000A9E0371|nr:MULTISPECIES: two-component regulator propeller domain-containing protein [unclassified Spirosoma]
MTNELVVMANEKWISYLVSYKWPSRSLSLFHCSLFIIYCPFFIVHYSFAQIGTWQTHVSYQSGQSVAVVGNKVYAATQNGFFYYDKVTQETTSLTKNSGLSDAGISRLLYLADQSTLLIAYRSGNLDFMTLTNDGEPGAVSNVNTIVAASTLPSARTIYHINRIGNNAYLSTDFGLAVLDLIKHEIKDTYFSQRTDGTPLAIYQTVATTDSLYALTGPIRATDMGFRLRSIRFAANVNIVDPANWRNVVEPAAMMSSLIVDQNRLYVSVNGTGIYLKNNGSWVLFRSSTDPIIRLFPSAAGPIVATSQSILLPNPVTFTGPLLTNPREVVADGTNVWVADTQNGLLYGSTGQFQRIAPEGPTRDQYVGLYTYPQTLITLPTGPLDATTLSTNQPPYEAFLVTNNRWVAPSTNGLARGFNAAAYLPSEQRLYVSTFGAGLWSQSGDQLPTPVTLPATISPFISSLATDSEGNLWITTGRTTSSQSATLHVRKPDGTFQSFPVVTQTNILQIVPDDNGFLWLRPDVGGGLLVVDPQTNRSRYLTTQTGQGGLLTNSVRALVKDRNGVIWVGTDLGPTLFDNPAGAFDAVIDAQPPILNRRRLLANEQITAIAVDGGNRKWIGTQKGIYHVAPDGSQLLDTFTADNSPLPSNTIQALAIEPTRGALFVQTPNGLVSYQTPATEPTDVLTNITIFPNPVRPDFSGNVGIQGLTENATVKILDAGGKLVYETRSQGGTATWNLIDYQGRQAQTGIYLIVVVTKDGAEGLAGKLAVVR